ncbi:MAG: hypothetical protein ACYS47_17095 [Planctomycetota bacterium]
MGIDLVWKMVEGRGHDAGFFVTFKDEVCDFYAKHPRDPFPKTVDWQVDPTQGDDALLFPANTFRWVRVEETGETQSRTDFEDGKHRILRSGLPRIRARAEGNRVAVETSKVRKFSILVSEKMFDLKKEIEVVTNGKTSFKAKVPGDPKVLLEEARRYNDRELVFHARITVEVE